MPDTAAPSQPHRPLLQAGLLAGAAFASIGAGTIHAAAAGVHGEHTAAMVTFALVAVAQVGWGALLLARPSRPLAVAGAALGAALLGGWALAKTSGIGFISGLEGSEAVQLSDGLAAALAAGSAIAALVWAYRPAPVSTRRSLTVAATAALLAGSLALPGMVAAADHVHDHDHTPAADHDHAADGGGDAAAGDMVADDDHAHEPAVVPPTPYDPDLPLNLSGVEGVTLEQQARAEQLIAVTLYRLPQFADPADAEAAGYRSIGDGVTGYEHYINWDLIDDDKILDPDHPESLVYEVRGGEKTLVSAMYMLPRGSTLDDVPDIGGKLTQWHVHDDLCFTDDPEAPTVASVTAVGGSCPPHLVKFDPVPMIHVWIVPHPCGPFAALEGVAGGQVAEGEEHFCDHAHGSGGF